MIHPRLEETGQTMAEYAVVLSVITVGVVLALSQFGAAILAGIERAVSLVPH